MIDACLAGRVNQVGLNMRNEADGLDVGEGGVALHAGDDSQRIGTRIVEIENDQRRTVGSHLRQRGVARFRDQEGGADLLRRGPYLGREEQIVEDC